MIKVRTLRWRDYPGLSQWAQCNHRALIRERQEGQSERTRTTEAEVRAMQGPEPRGVHVAPQEAGKGNERDSPLEFPKGTSPANTLTLVQ